MDLTDAVTRSLEFLRLSPPSVESFSKQKNLNQAVQDDLGQPSDEISDRFLIKSVESYLLGKPGLSRPEAESHFRNGLAILDRILVHVESGKSSQTNTILELNAASTILLQLGALEGLTAENKMRSLNENAFRLLKVSFSFEPRSSVDILGELSHVTDDPLGLLVPFMTWLCQNYHVLATRTVMRSLGSGPELQKLEMIGETIESILRRSARMHAAFDDTKKFYEALCESGLFAETDDQSGNNIRLLMALMAQEAGDFEIATAALKDVHLDLVQDNVSAKIRFRILEKLAKLGQWTTIRKLLRDLERAPEFRSTRRNQDGIESSPHQLIDPTEHSPFRSAVENFPLSVGISDQKNSFHLLELLSMNGQWALLCQMYQRIVVNDPDITRSCGRLVVDAVINGAKSADDREAFAEQTIRQIVQAHRKGFGVSDALTPALIERFNSSFNISDDIADMVGEGIAIPDAAYNKAANILIQQGRYMKAREVCETAAKENGNDDLCYSDFNFSNLLYINVATRRYSEIAPLITSFTSQSSMSCGSKICKEAIKHARKILRRRAEIEPGAAGTVLIHKALAQLEDGFEHTRKCREDWKQKKKQLVERRRNRSARVQLYHNLGQDEPANTEVHLPKTPHTCSPRPPLVCHDEAGLNKATSMIP